MSNDEHSRIMQDAALEWALSYAQTTLASIERAQPGSGAQSHLVDLDRRVAERAASLVDEGLDAGLASLWERTARDVIGACLAAHDESAASPP